MRRIGTYPRTREELVPILHTREELVSILHTCKQTVPNPHTCDDVNYLSESTTCAMRVKNWNRMQNAAAFGGYLIDVSNMNDGYIEFDYVRISLTCEKYWYEIRDVLVPILHTVLEIGTILHGVKFT